MRLLPFLYTWHRRLALLFTVVIIAWVLSGVLHPLISRMSVPPALPAPPQPMLSVAALQSAKTVLQLHDITELHSLQLLHWQQHRAYQAQQAAGALPIYLDAETGEALPEFGEQRAVALARLYARAEHAEIASIETFLAFDHRYTTIQRYLPAYGIRFANDSDLTVYVDALSGRPAGMEHRTQRFWRQVFQWLHTFSFLPEDGKRPFQFALIVAALALGAFGLLLWWQQRQRPALNNQRRWHRRLGLPSSIILLMFAFSGAWHVLHKMLELTPEASARAAMNVADMPQDWPLSLTFDQPIHWLRLQQHGDDWLTFWQRQPEPKTNAPAAHHGHEQTRAVSANFGWWRNHETIGAQQAMSMIAARHQCPLNADAEISVVERFGGDYGFLQKRLPVLRLPCADGNVLFIDPFEDHRADWITPAVRAESWSFHYLHKWHFLDALGRNGRDLAMVIAVLMLLPLSAIGFTMYWQRHRQANGRR